MHAKSPWASGRVTKGSLLVLACGVVGAAAIHRLTHGVWFGDSGSRWPLPPEARRGEWTRWTAVPMQPPILGVWGASPDNVWAWGRLDIIHWDGRAWSRVKRPDVNPGTIVEMGGSAEAVWVRVEHDGRECVGPSGSHWDDWCDTGDGWRPGACPTTGRDAACAGRAKAVGEEELTRLWAAHLVTVEAFAPFPELALSRGYRVGPNEVWAIGGGGSFLGHFDGKRWTVGAARSPLLEDLSGIWFASETDGWAIAGRTILRWDGRRWTLAQQTSARLLALWGSASDDVWAVGDEELAMHWDGRRWSESRLVGAPILTALVGRGKNDVWTGGCTRDSVVLFHWNGWSWRRQDAVSYQLFDRLSTPRPLLAATGDAQAVALIEGRLRSFEDGGASDSAIRTPTGRLDASVARPESISALVAVGPAEMWALGSRERDRPPFAPSPFAIHLAPGAPPKVRPLPGHGQIHAVWAHRPDDVWAVGTDGLVLHFDGEFWTRLPIDTDETLVAVHGAGRTVWIAGHHTLLRRRF